MTAFRSVSAIHVGALGREVRLDDHSESLLVELRLDVDVVGVDGRGPLLYLQREELYTLQIGLRQFEAAAGGAPAWNQMMAASLVVMLPVIIVFVAFQRFFIEGVSLTGMGGR